MYYNVHMFGNKDKKPVRQEKINKEESIEGEIVQTHWDLRKIGIGLFIFAILFIIGAYIFFPSGGGQPENSSSTLGASTQSQTDTPPLPNKEDIQNVINNAQESLSKITADNVTSSDSAIQKIISDLEILRGNKSAKAAICNLVCDK